MPSYVVVPKQVEIDEKAAYIKQMLGPHASLAEVASMYLQLYAATNRDKAKQKSGAIDAWKLYSGEEFGKKIQNVPFPERTEFLRVWDASLPDRCCICEGVAEVRRDGRMYCGSECIMAGMELVCRRCDRAAYFEGEMPLCSACDVHKAGGYSDSLALATLMWTNRFRRRVTTGNKRRAR